jgi:hypothetical protein
MGFDIHNQYIHRAAIGACYRPIGLVSIGSAC